MEEYQYLNNNSKNYYRKKNESLKTRKTQLFFRWMMKNYIYFLA